MKNLIFGFAALAVLTLTNCTVTAVDENYSEDVIGTYIMTEYETHSGESTPSPDDVVEITAVDDKTVDILINYASITTADVSLTNVEVTKPNSSYDLDRTFSNATAIGNVLDDELLLRIDYDNGNFAKITAVK